MVVDLMLVDKLRIWNTIELEKTYNSYGGHSLPRKLLIQWLSDLLSLELIVLSGAGVSSILVFTNEASKHMKLVS